MNYSSPEEAKRNRKHLLLGLLSGLLLGLSFPPIPLFLLSFIALIPYFYVIEQKKSLSEINRFTYAAMFIFNLITLYWVGSWTKEADTYLMISGSVLMFFNPLLFLIPSSLYYFSRKIFNHKISLFLFPLYWAGYEYLYSITDFRFPWLTLGNGLPYFNTFIQIADIIGAHGLTLLILHINILFYKTALSIYKKENWIRPAALALTIFTFVIVYGIYRTSSYEASPKKIKVGLIQPNLNPWDKWQLGDLNNIIDLYFTLSDSAIAEGADILLWPETALPVYLLSGTRREDAERIFNYVDSAGISLLTGMPDATFYFNKETAPETAKPTGSGNYLYTSYNSILLFTPGSRDVQRYGKIKLVPFGEKVPLVDQLPFLGDIFKWNVGITSWNTGEDTTIFKIKNEDDFTNIGGVICIESIYPEFCTEFVQKGAEILAVVTNDSWYGNSSGPYQHKEISALRAVENRRSVLRAANGGISCLIDPLGRTVASTTMFIRKYLVVEAELNNTLTFYTKYPLLIPFISVAAILLIIFTNVYLVIKSKIRKKI